MSLEWRRGSDYHLESKCKRYTVDKALMKRGMRYTAWFCTAPVATNLGCFNSADLAKQQCETHFQSSRTQPSAA